MKQRPPDRRRMDAMVLRAIQRERLVGINRGQIEPVCDREEFFLWCVQAGDRPKYADFILPPLLFIAEQTRIELEAAGEDADADADEGADEGEGEDAGASAS